MGSVREDLRDQVVAIHETATEAWSDVVLFIRETWPALIVLLTLLILALWIADPAPPRHVSIAAGLLAVLMRRWGKSMPHILQSRALR